jgi:hypothetical protein
VESEPYEINRIISTKDGYKNSIANKSSNLLAEASIEMEEEG